ncbi:DNA mismatch repair protein MutS2 [Pontibacter ummariensis]|uniref:Endonuclease MutS2 n=1 Tax=Pontibacter ummariensis TaxID=1610492 RepID=A0A239C8P3_9BACT|nr:endonuclease MutS2 [Pontibacter ummariensis]PRY15409.1 DNA mismatch repair protein MutS2 [Pontibacter ummariensis]SNS16028.1 DNA mismatch repair protein MutS2 [Pontibacter ummariensis]
MIYPENFEIKIGFAQVREMLSDLCLSPLGQQFVNRMAFLNRHDLVQRLLQQTNEFKQLLESDAEIPLQYYFDVTSSLDRAAIEGTYLDVKAFFEIKMSLRTIRDSLRFISGAEEGKYEALKALGTNVVVERSLIAALDKVVDDAGAVRDDATPELQRLKRELIAQQGVLRKTISSIMRHAKNEGWTPSDSEPTIRGGRLVIPVIAEHKRRIKGLIHDESNTGQTVYIEPESIFELNNDIKDLENAYHRELVRILTGLTNTLRHHIPELRKAYQYLGLLDFIRAKAAFARRIEGTMPKLQKHPHINWKQAFHPLLYLAHRQVGKSVVPMDLELNRDQRILLISGPNAGGKSVSLKTVGLLQYMLQCGLLIPAADGSEAGIFQDIFIDIGDEQSIENDLSTYSSHLTNMKKFVTVADNKSLVLVDEFGTGTEPILGGAIAEAVLQTLNDSKVYGVITTHYTNLKNYAEKTPGIVNGAMRYDHKHLQPLYQLEIGKPGSSFAIEIAQKIGLPKHIIDRASKLVGKDKIRYDRLLEELETEKQELEQKVREAAKLEQKLAKSVKEYNDLRNYLEDSKQDIMREAKGKAKLLLKDANQKIESTIQQIKQSQAEKEKTKEARRELEEFSQEVRKEEKRPAYKRVTNGTIKEGDNVSLVGQDSYGQVVSIKGKTAEVLFGGLKTIVKVDNLEKVEGQVAKPKKAKAEAAEGYTRGMNITKRLADFTSTLDIRGEYAEDALTKVMNFTDEAVMLGIPEIKIIHGRGNGVLRQVVRDYLHSVPEVASLGNEASERGGDGATLAVLK